MNEDNILHLLRSIQVGIAKKAYTGSDKTTRWLNISCPFAPYTHAKRSDNNPSFGITIKDGSPSSYTCFSCNAKGRLSRLPTVLGGYRKRDYSKQRLWAEIAEAKGASTRPLPGWEDSAPTIDYKPRRDRHVDPDQTVPDHPSDAGYQYAFGIKYLSQRGLTFLDILRLDLRYDDFQKRVLFPVYNKYGDFAGFTGRSIIKGNNVTKGSNPKVKDYLGLKKREVLLGPRKPKPGKKIIHEGLFDYARGVSYGYPNSRAILGTSLTADKLDILVQEAEPVYFFMDNDLPGWQALFGIPDKDGGWNETNAWAYRLYHEIPVWIVPYAKVFDGLDPGSITSKERYDAHVKRAWLFTGKRPLARYGEPKWSPKT